MKNDKFNFYQTHKGNKKHLYALVGVLAMGSLVLSQLALPLSAAGYWGFASEPSYYYSYYDDYDYGYYDSYYYDDYYYGYDSYYDDYDYGYGGYYDYGYYYDDYYYDSYSYYDYDYSTPFYTSYTDYSYYDYDDYDYGYYDDYYYGYDSYYDDYYYEDYYEPYSYQPTFSNYFYPKTSLAPRFNIYTPYVHEKTEGHDYYLLDVKNDTKNTGWGFPVSADPGDVLIFSVYYHNAIIDTTAINTTLKVDLPSGIAPYHTVTGYLWADNAENATPSNPLSQSLQVNLSSPANLEFIQGSVKWYPDQKDWHFDPPTPLPYGQSGSELLGTGLRIGDIKGCWEYSGYVNFKVKVGQAIPAQLQIDKKARNLTQGQYDFSDTVYARPSNRIEFLIEVQAGASVAKNVHLVDFLPDKLTYLSGTLRVNGQLVSGSVDFEPGLPLGNIQPGQIVRVTFEANTKEAWVFPQGETTLINRAVVRADNASSKDDTATVIVKSICDPDINYPAER